MDDRLKGLIELLAAIVIGVAAFFFSPWLAEHFAGFGYIGVFLFSIVSSATIFLPVPSWILVFSLAHSLNPLLLGIVAGVGSGIGELSGYFLGHGGTHMLAKNKELLDRHKKWLGQAEFVTLFTLAFLPNPIFDIAGIAAGALKIPLWRFLPAVILGKTARFIILAYFGAHLLGRFI